MVMTYLSQKKIRRNTSSKSPDVIINVSIYIYVIGCWDTEGLQKLRISGFFHHILQVADVERSKSLLFIIEKDKLLVLQIVCELAVYARY